MTIKFSIIIYVDEVTDLKRCLDSIEENYINNMEVIIEDVTSDNLVKEFLNSYERLNIIYRKNTSKSMPFAYNDGLKVAKGTYVNFINRSAYYVSNLFSDLKNIAQDIIVINVKFYDQDTNLFSNYVMQPKKTQKIDLNENPFKLCTALEGYIIKRDIIESNFDESLDEECRFKFIYDLLKNHEKYSFIGNKYNVISSKPFEDNTSKNAIQYNSLWYIPTVENFILPAIKEFHYNLPLYIQELFMYMIFARYNCNLNDRNKNVLTKQEFLQFNKRVSQVLKYIDDSIILQRNISSKHEFKIPRWLRFVFLKNKMNYLKENNLVHIVQDDLVNIEYDNKLTNLDIIKFGKINNESINIYAINYKNGKLVFDCDTSLSDFLDKKDIKIFLKYNDKRIEVKKNECYSMLKVFGHTVANKCFFSFEIDALPKDKNELHAFANINNKEIHLKFNFVKVQARLNHSTKSYWGFKNVLLLNKQNFLIIKRNSKFRVIKSEILFDLSKFKNEKNKIRVLKLIFLRILYYITKPFYKNKHIWLTFDKLYKAGDNGEYLYQYGLKNGYNIYYIIKKDSNDYERLVKQNRKHILVFNSLKAKLLSLHAEVILKTHANVISYCGFDGLARDMVSGLFNAEIVEVQHGLTIQKIAQYQNRLFDNIKLYCCASKYEIENITDPHYNFSKNDLKLTGLARYDGLKSKGEKIVLITPTWRRNVVNSNIVHIKKKHNNNFIHSDYYKIYNSLINNKKLIACAKQCNYKLVYLLHPAMSSQIDDFDKNDYVELIPATGNMNYEKILTESSIMITDYSGVQFDFAYQRKPIIYYHPDKLPPHYEAGGLDYKKMGFGEICKDEDTLVSEICKYMQNNCQIEEKYKKRADKFFAFDDYNNCERIFATVKDYLKKNK